MDLVAKHHPPIEWVDIDGDGSERPRSGRVWTPAAAVSGLGKAWWVLPERAGAPEASSEPLALLVARLPVPVVQEALDGLQAPSSAPVRTYRPGRVVRGRWYAAQGRLIFPGETIRETHPASLFARREAVQRTLQVPTSVRLQRASITAQAELDAFVRAAQQ